MNAHLTFSMGLTTLSLNFLDIVILSVASKSSAKIKEG